MRQAGFFTAPVALLSTSDRGMRLFFVGWFIVVFALAAGAPEKHSLPGVGSISLPEGWRELERGTNTTQKPAEHWVTFQKQTNELLSILVQPHTGWRSTNTIHFADPAHEVFSNDGRYWGTRTNRVDDSTAYNIRLRVVAVDRFEALEYSYVLEPLPPRENRLAHGYVLFGDVTVFLQHTSTRPIPPDVAEGVAYSVMRQLEKVSAPKNLRRFTKRESY
jgi:hypothetical protein